MPAIAARSAFRRSPALRQVALAALIGLAVPVTGFLPDATAQSVPPARLAQATPVVPAAPVPSSAPAALAPGGGYADPQAPPPAPPAADVEPVMRAAAVDTLATIRQRGTLRVGVVPVAPMVMRDAGGRLSGFSVDLARRLADDLGLALEFVETSWHDVLPDLLERRSDVVITGLWLSVPRALVVNFTRPTAREGLYVFARPAAARGGLDALDGPGTRIAVAADPTQQQLARDRFPRASIRVVDGDPLRALLDGRADAVVFASLSPKAVEAALRRRAVLVSELPLASTAAAMAVRKGDPDFLAFLDTWLDIQRERGWIDERARHWATVTDAPR